MSERTDQIELGVLIRDTLGIGVGGIIAGLLFSTDHPALGVFFSVLVAVSFCHILTHALSVKFPQNRQEFEIFFFCVVAYGLIFSPALIPDPPGRPQFAFAIQMPNSKERVPLTNDFFYAEATGLPGTNIRGFLMLPVDKFQTRFPFTFVIRNSSSVIAEDVKVTFHVPEEFDGDGTSWDRAETQDHIIDREQNGILKTNLCVAWTTEFPSMHAGDGYLLPNIFLPKKPQHIVKIYCGLSVKAKDSDYTGIGFFAVLMATNDALNGKWTQLRKPLVIFARTNAGGTYINDEDFR